MIVDMSYNIESLTTKFETNSILKRLLKEEIKEISFLGSLLGTNLKLKTSLFGFKGRVDKIVSNKNQDFELRFQHCIDTTNLNKITLVYLCEIENCKKEMSVQNLDNEENWENYQKIKDIFVKFKEFI